MKIGIFGTGYVGLVTGACLANLGHEILCCDINKEKIENLQKGIISFYEPNLKETMIHNVHKKRLSFTTNIKETVDFGEVIFNCVGTPNKEDGSCDLQFVYNVTRSVGEYAQGYKLLANKSTVPPGTARKCQDIIKITNRSSQVEVISNPEFLKEGSAVYDFTHPDKIVVGAKNNSAFSILRKVYTGRVRTYIPFLETYWETAEMIKYANNSFLATKISFINEIANICDVVGADVKLISQALGMDYRISPKFLNPGIGYGGSCFPKDVRALANAAKEKGYIANLLNEVDLLNERQKSRLFEKVKQKFNQNLQGKTFTIWGLSFKPKTSDIREASSLVIIQKLLEHGATVKVHDPVALEEVKVLFKNQIVYCNTLKESVEDSSGILLITEWDDYRNVPFIELGKFMKEKNLFDGRNIYEPEIVIDEGFEYYGVGRR
jgi:UDPglucose 6-dehydrogenase